MATKKFYKLVAFGSIVLALFTAFTMLSCDKRHAVSSSNEQAVSGISNVLLSLNPPQLRLSSRDAIDTVVVGIAVVDSNGVGVSGMQPHITRTPQIGFLTQPDSTDAMGATYALFIATPGVYGSTEIIARVGTIADTMLLPISGPTNYNLNLTYAPPIPKLIDHEADPYVITANLVDATQRGVAGQQMIFSVLNGVGRLGFADTTVTIPRTNSQGVAQALFYNTETDEQRLPDSALIQVITRADTGSGMLATTVTIPLRQVHNTLSVQAIPNTVVGDGASHTTIRAFLLDTDGHGIVGDTIRLNNPDHLGSFVLSSIITDANGVATTNYTPYTGVVFTDTTQIVAEYRSGNIVHQARSTTDIAITPIRSIGYITVSLQRRSIVANGSDTSAIFITVQDSTGSLISDGTVIHLENTGFGNLSTPQVSTTAGQAKAKITAPTTITGGDTDTIRVCGNINDSTTICASVVVTYVAGSVNTLAFVYPDSTVTLIAGSGDTCSVVVFAQDVNGNPVANGTQITFENLNVPTSSLTPHGAGTFNGYARSIYLIGSGTGDDNVRGWIVNPTNVNDTIRTLHPVVFQCISSSATTLRLTASQTNIMVGGASSQIIATLQDAYGNPLSAGYLVTFDITVSPGLPDSAGQKPSFDTQSLLEHDTVLTNINGQAIIQLYSGVRSGAVSIKACTVPMPPEYLNVCNEKSLVTISSGPPQHLNFAVTNDGEAQPPARFVQVGAVVTDRFSNPVDWGTAVYFSVTPADIIAIEGDSYTGGPRFYHPDSTGGVAYTRIIYGCYSTFNYVRIIASSAGDSIEVADTSGPFLLPIYQGTINEIASPGNIRLLNPTGIGSYDTSFVTAYLTDGGGCAIKGGIIQFSAQICGNILAPSTVTTDSLGAARCKYLIRYAEIPCDQFGICSADAIVRAVLVQKPSVVGTVTITVSHP